MKENKCLNVKLVDGIIWFLVCLLQELLGAGCTVQSAIKSFESKNVQEHIPTSFCLNFV